MENMRETRCTKRCRGSRTISVLLAVLVILSLSGCFETTDSTGGPSSGATASASGNSGEIRSAEPAKSEEQPQEDFSGEPINMQHICGLWKFEQNNNFAHLGFYMDGTVKYTTGLYYSDSGVIFDENSYTIQGDTITIFLVSPEYTGEMGSQPRLEATILVKVIDSASIAVAWTEGDFVFGYFDNFPKTPDANNWVTFIGRVTPESFLNDPIRHITTAELNLRTGPGTEYELVEETIDRTVIPVNTVITQYGEMNDPAVAWAFVEWEYIPEGGYFYFRHQRYYGWVSTEYIRPAIQS